MNKKQLIIAAMAAVLSVTGANATSYITDVTNGGSGTFNIDPAKVNGDVGYRAYEQFNVGSNDTANLIFKNLSGDQRNIETFINLVRQGVDIQGIVNSMRDGSFYNGHAVFITPGGLTIGSSGVLNVGRLSVATPTSSKFNSLMSEYDAQSFSPVEINKISKLKQEGNAPINVQGYIFSRRGVDLPGSTVNVSGKIVNGMADENAISSASQAQTLFESLVNTDGSINANAATQSNGSLVFLHSFSNTADKGINVSGTVANLTAAQDFSNPSVGALYAGRAKDGSVALTSASGLDVSGKVLANGKLSLYNKGGNMNVSGKLENKNGELAVTNDTGAGSMTLTSSARLNNTNGDVSVINNGTGALNHAADVNTTGDLNIVNDQNGSKSAGMTITGSNEADTVRIMNRAGKLTFSGNAEGRTVSLRNKGQSGMEIGGTVSASEGVLVDNYAGNADLIGSVDVSYGNIAVRNRNTAGKLTTSSASDMEVTGTGFIAVKNESASGSEFNGSITANNGEVALNNTAGAMLVNGEVTTRNGNMGIINRANGTGLTLGANADISSKGTLKIVNQSGSNGLTVADGADVSNNGEMFVYNEKGQLTINGRLANQGSNLYVISRNNSTGIVTGEDSEIVNTSGIGNLAIKHKSGTTGGVDLNGTISNQASGKTAINNYGTGNMHVGGTVTSKNEMGIINRAAGGTMNVNATINANGSETNIKNLGNGNMTVAGTINHKGRLNILGNKNKTILDGTINNLNTANNGYSTMTYATSRANGTGLEATSNFNANSTHGDILIKNITGQNGLSFAGTINSTNGQAEVYNKAGDLTITSSANVSGNQAFILNTGNGLTVESTKLPSNIMIVNKGSQHASVPSKYNNSNNFREKLKN